MSDADAQKKSTKTNGKRKHENKDKHSENLAEIEKSSEENDDTEEISDYSLNNSISTNAGSLSNSIVSTHSKNKMSKQTKDKNKKVSEANEIKEEEDSENDTDLGTNKDQENEVILANQTPQRESRLDFDHLSSMSKAVFNTILGTLFIFVVVCIIAAVFQDFTKKRNHEMDNLLLEIQQCKRDYESNYCDPPEDRVPMMVEKCLKFEKCFKRDPNTVGISTKMASGMLAECLNEFVEPLSLKAIVFFFCLLFGMILFCGCLGRGGNSRKFERNFERRMEEMDRRLERMEKLLKRTVEAQHATNRKNNK